MHTRQPPNTKHSSSGLATLKVHLLGACLIIRHFLERMDLERIIQSCLPRCSLALSHGKILAVLVQNLIVSPAPLYRIAEWANPFEASSLGLNESEKDVVNDDRVARSLDALASEYGRTLVRNGMRRLPKRAARRAIHNRRYAKEVPGHHIQVDAKFVSLWNFESNRVRRFQYTAIDDATRIRAMRIYPRHNQQNAIKFIDYVIEKFPFRIHTIRKDRVHEFQAQFHWHVEDKGIRHVYTKPRSPQLNGKVERYHRTDEGEFYQLLTYTDYVDLNEKLAEWERFYNLDRPHGAFKGKTPYEALEEYVRIIEILSERV